MTAPRYNIRAGYDLAETAIAMLSDPEEAESLYLDDVVGARTAEFWTLVRRPEKRTLVHGFLEGLELIRWEQTLDVVSPSIEFPLLCRYLKACGFTLPDWFDLSVIDNHRGEVWNLVTEAAPIAASAAFQLLFQDREFLLDFHTKVASAVSRIPSDDLPANAGFPVPRCTYVPEWLKKAIYHRDRGLCQHCGRDVSGLLNLEGVLHLDHLLPLNSGGTNDATNFQLLCKKCNLSKSGRRAAVFNRNHAFW